MEEQESTLGTEAGSGSESQPPPIELKQEDMIEFAQIHHLNGQITAYEDILSLKRDQLAFAARTMITKRLSNLRAASRAAGRRAAKTVDDQLTDQPSNQVENNENIQSSN